MSASAIAVSVLPTPRRADEQEHADAAAAGRPGRPGPCGCAGRSPPGRGPGRRRARASLSLSFRTVSISSRTILPTGMPVQPGDDLGDRAAVDDRVDERRSRPARLASSCAAARVSSAFRPSRRSSLPASRSFSSVVAPFADLARPASAPRRAASSSVVALRLGDVPCARFSSPSRSSWSAPAGRARARATRSRRRGARSRGCASSSGRRRRRLAQRHAGAGRVEQADRLVRQLAVGDVAGARAGPRRRRPRRGCGPCGASPASATRPRIMRIGLLLVRLVDLDHLEAALQGGVGLEVLLVLRRTWWPRWCAVRRGPGPA